MSNIAPAFDQMFGHMSQIFGELWGSDYRIELHDGREIVVRGIYSADHVDWSLHDGVEQRMPWPKLDLRRADLIAAGVSEPESDLDQARVALGDGSDVRILSEVRDDYRVMVKCRVSRF